MPCSENQDGVVIWRFVDVRDTGQVSRDTKDSFEMGNFKVLGARIYSAQITVFGFGQRESARDHSGLLEQQGVEFGQLNGGAGFVGVGGNRGWNQPARITNNPGSRCKRC